MAVLPGRHPVLVAKQLVSLAVLGPKRVLPVFGLRPASRAEWDLFPVPEGQRAAVFDEALTVVRALLDADEVSVSGRFFQLDNVTLGIRAPAPVDLAGRSAPPRFAGSAGWPMGGWAASSPPAKRAGSGKHRRAAADNGRQIEPDHYGLSLAVGNGALPEEVLTAVRARRPDADPGDLVAADWPQLHRQLDGMIAAGLTKFVIRPWDRHPAKKPWKSSSTVSSRNCSRQN